MHFRRLFYFMVLKCLTLNMSNKRSKTNGLNSCKKKKFNDFESYVLKNEEINDINVGCSGDCTFIPNIHFDRTNRVVIENSLPQIAIKKKNNDSLTDPNSEVVLLNGNWDTSNSIPNIVAEMHNVKLEELQSTWVGEAGDAFFLDTHDPLKLKVEDFTLPLESPRGSDSGLGSDSPEGNLSWLLNFKLDEIPGLPDCISQISTKRYTPRKNSDCQNKVGPVYIAETIPKQYFEQHRVQNVNVARIIHEQSRKEEISASPAKTSTHSNRYSGARKPPFTYTELIEHALREKGELTVSGIYQWISDHFSFYKANDDRWKNSVRHNLSINPHFRKGNKAVHGAGHLWTIAQKDDSRNTSSWNIKRQRMQQFMQNAANNFEKQEQEIELAVATASILPDGEIFQHNGQHQEQQQEQQQQQEHHQQQQQQEQQQQSQLKVVDAHNDEQIQQAANDILNGFKREVEVQYVIPVGNTMGMDFLCPVSKEQVAAECGLTGDQIQITENDYLITDLNPNTLGLNLSEAEIITTDQLFSDDLNFQCYELSTEQ